MGPFITRSHELAALFTDHQWSNKYLDSGLKPLEEFATDILDNLVAWYSSGNIICYRTRDHWYYFDVQTSGQFKGVVFMTRYTNGSWARVDSWANQSSVLNLGRQFLSQHPEKRCDVFCPMA